MAIWKNKSTGMLYQIMGTMDNNNIPLVIVSPWYGHMCMQGVLRFGYTLSDFLDKFVESTRQERDVVENRYSIGPQYAGAVLYKNRRMLFSQPAKVMVSGIAALLVGCTVYEFINESF